jgi:hypothetical protein
MKPRGVSVPFVIFVMATTPFASAPTVAVDFTTSPM